MRVSLPMYIFFSPVFLTFKNSYRLRVIWFLFASIRSLGIYRAIADRRRSTLVWLQMCQFRNYKVLLFYLTRCKKSEILNINRIALDRLHFVHTRIQNQLNMYKIIKNNLSRDVCSSISTYKRLIVKSRSRT